MAVTDIADPFDMSFPAPKHPLSKQCWINYTRKTWTGKLVQVNQMDFEMLSVWMLGFGQFDILILESLEKLIETHIDLTQANSFINSVFLIKLLSFRP